MLSVDMDLRPTDLAGDVDRLFAVAAPKIRALAARWKDADGAPVFTTRGRYGARGWTEWTQGFRVGAALLVYEATRDTEFLELGRSGTLEWMGPHLTHTGVHDHGFHNVSTYGNLLRLIAEGKLPASDWECRYYELALRASGAVQAARWASLPSGGGYVYSFNGPHSLFADTMRSMRVLELADKLGGVLLAENDARVDLLERALAHAEATARYIVYCGEGRDAYDVRGRVAHEAIFNRVDGAFRCPSTQQGYSPFTTWTRALACIVLGFAEELEYLQTLPAERLAGCGGKVALEARFAEVGRATADYYLATCMADGIPHWDTGAPGVAPNVGSAPSDPWNADEPVDSSAAAIVAQGLLRLGRALGETRYTQAGLTIARRLLDEPYLSVDPEHEGLLLHAIYHRPQGWDHVPDGRAHPCGEATMWGDYHLLELGVMLARMKDDAPWHAFFNVGEGIDA